MAFRIDNEEAVALRTWFDRYVQGFQSEQPAIQQNFDFKRAHTLRVCQESIWLGRQLGLTDDALRLAEIIALFHDIGRFEQYARYHTFKDSRSENHAHLGVNILEAFGVLSGLGDTVARIILNAIRNHNCAGLPAEEDDPGLFYSRLIRDADKLDIWKALTDYYSGNNAGQNGALELDLPDTPGISDQVIRDLMDKKIVLMGHVNNCNDFKLLQIGWVFDINFQPTFACIQDRGYIEMIRNVLPKTRVIDQVVALVYDHLDRQLGR